MTAAAPQPAEDGLPRCEHCGQVIRRKPRGWTPDPETDATIAEAAAELNISRERAYQLVEDRWLTVSGRYFGKRPKQGARGVLYVTRESIADATNRRPNILSESDKRNILQTLSDVGVIGPLKWKNRRYKQGYWL